MPHDLLKHTVEHRWQALALTDALRRACGLFAGPDLASLRGRLSPGDTRDGRKMLHPATQYRATSVQHQTHDKRH